MFSCALYTVNTANTRHAFLLFLNVKSEVGRGVIPSVMEVEPQHCPDCDTDGWSSCNNSDR